MCSAITQGGTTLITNIYKGEINQNLWHKERYWAVINTLYSRVLIAGKTSSTGHVGASVRKSFDRELREFKAAFLAASPKLVTSAQ